MSISITYVVQPPRGITTSIPAESTVTYDARDLRNAQRSLNDALTVWKDAIGDLEKAKEDPGKVPHGQGKVARMLQDSDSECGLDLILGFANHRIHAI